MMKLDELRQKIDLVDKEILDLFVKRLDLIREISKVKFNSNIEIEDKYREEEILNRVRKDSREYSNFIEDLFKQILRVSKELQSKIDQK